MATSTMKKTAKTMQMEWSMCLRRIYRARLPQTTSAKMWCRRVKRRAKDGLMPSRTRGRQVKRTALLPLITPTKPTFGWIQSRTKIQRESRNSIECAKCSILSSQSCSKARRQTRPKCHWPARPCLTCPITPSSRTTLLLNSINLYRSRSLLLKSRRREKKRRRRYRH